MHQGFMQVKGNKYYMQVTKNLVRTRLLSSTSADRGLATFIVHESIEDSVSFSARISINLS